MRFLGILFGVSYSHRNGGCRDHTGSDIVLLAVILHSFNSVTDSGNVYCLPSKLVIIYNILHSYLQTLPPSQKNDCTNAQQVSV